MKALRGISLSVLTVLFLETVWTQDVEYVHHRFRIEHHSLEVRVEITQQKVPKDFWIELSVKEKLQMFTLIVEEVGTGCKVFMPGNKLVENFDNLDQFIDEDEKWLKPLFLEMNSQGGDLFQVDNFFLSHWSTESKHKYLPYEIRQLKDLYTFRLTEYPNHVKDTALEVIATPACKPTINQKDFYKLHPWYKDKDHTGQDSFHKDNRTAAAYQSDVLHAQQHSKRPLHPNERPRRRRLQRKRRQANNVTTESPLFDPNECTFNADIDRWQCKVVTANILHEDQRHVLMIVIFMQAYLVSMCGAFKPGMSDFEVCTVTQEPYHFYDKDTEIGSGVDRDKFTMHECCEVQVHTRDAFSMTNLKPGQFAHTYWVCHDPYALTRFTLGMIPVIAFFLTLLSPMFIVSWLPGLKSASAKRRLTQLEQSLRKKKRKQKRNAAAADQDPSKSTGKASEKDKAKAKEKKDRSLKIKLDEDNQPQTELIPPEAEQPFDPDNTDFSATRWNLAELIWLDLNPVYTFNFKTIFSYLLLFNVENQIITVIRRFLFFFALIGLLFLGLAQLQIFYTTISYRTVLWIFRPAFENILALHLTNEDDFLIGMMLYVVALPAVIAAILFVLLYPIFSQARSIAETLHWEESETKLGRHMAENCQIVQKRHDCFESKLVDNMTVRCGYLARGEMYKYFGEQFIVALPLKLYVDDDEDFFSTRLTKRFLVSVWYVMRFPIFLFVVPVHVFPVFTMWYALFLSPSRVLPSTNPLGGIYRCCRMPIIFLGLGLLNVIAFYLCVVYGQMVVFLVVDFVRNMQVEMPKIIFYLSLVFNVNASFTKLSDEYLDLKGKIFDILKETEKPQPLEPTLEVDPVTEEPVDKRASLLLPDNKRQSTMTEDILMGDLEKLEAKIDKLFQIAKIPGDDEEGEGSAPPPEDETPPVQPPPLLIGTADGELAMPQIIFDYVAERHMPYSSKVGSMLCGLAIHLIIITFLFLIVLDFQVLDALQDVGQGIITLITVSLPSMASSAAAAGLASLQEERFMNELRQTVLALKTDKKFWMEYMQERDQEAQAERAG